MLFEKLFDKDSQSRIESFKPFVGKQVSAWTGAGMVTRALKMVVKLSLEFVSVSNNTKDL